MQKIRVLLVDDHTVVRQGLRALLTADGGIEIIGESENGREAIELACRTTPDVVVMDLAMPSMNGLEATKRILKHCPSTKVLVLSSYSDDEYVQQLTEAGAVGYLAKQSAANELLDAIRAARQGKTFYSQNIARRLRGTPSNAQSRKSGTTSRADHLTPRESEVLQLIAEGKPNKHIASDLGISIKTVEKHRQQVMNKLNIHDVAGLTRHALAKGIIENTGLPSI